MFMAIDDYFLLLPPLSQSLSLSFSSFCLTLQWLAPSSSSSPQHRDDHESRREREICVDAHKINITILSKLYALVKSSSEGIKVKLSSMRGWWVGGMFIFAVINYWMKLFFPLLSVKKRARALINRIKMAKDLEQWIVPSRTLWNGILCSLVLAPLYTCVRLHSHFLCEIKVFFMSEREREFIHFLGVFAYGRECVCEMRCNSFFAFPRRK